MSHRTPDYLQPDRIAQRGDNPMTDAEKVEEFAFLMGVGVKPRFALEQIGTPSNLDELSVVAYDADLPEVGRIISRLAWEDAYPNRLEKDREEDL